jgi:formylglycine-generating enzyme required for sulfatase activity
MGTGFRAAQFILTGITVLSAMSACARAQEAEKPMVSDMVPIPAGEFTMGISAEEAEELARQFNVHPSLFTGWTPRREVQVEGFYIDRGPVTNAQYKQFVDATGHRAPSGWTDGTYPEGKGDHPVVRVGANDALAYAESVGKRLPTAEEWEKAARGDDGRLYPWGNEWDDEACIIDDGTSPSVIGWTLPVGSLGKGASPYGVLDMVGNVAEWTGTESAPRNEERNWAWYEVKGAAYTHTQRYNFLCAARNFSAHQSRSHDWLGFRCAMDAATGPDGAPSRKRDTPFGPSSRLTSARTGAEGEASGRPETPAPAEEAFGEPIQISVRGASAQLRVPWLPLGGFSLYVPEQAGAKGLPLAWGLKHTGIDPIEGDGVTGYECTFEGKGVLKAELRAGEDFVDFTLTIRNLTDETLTGVHSNTCFNCGGSGYFRDPERVRSYVWTDDGPTCFLRMPHGGGGEPLHNGWAVAKADEPAPAGGSKVRYPFVFLRSRDGKWVVAQAYDEGITVASNAHYSCLHSRPTWPDIPPGEERSRAGKLYFIKGGPDELLARWRADFGTR